MQNLIALAGIAAVLAVAIALSYARRRIHWPGVLAALGMEVAIAGFFFLTPGKRPVLDALNTVVVKMLACAGEGIAFLFGPLAVPPPKGQFILGIQALPLIVFFAALLSLLYPERQRDLSRTLLAMAAQHGALPRWPL